LSSFRISTLADFHWVLLILPFSSVGFVIEITPFFVPFLSENGRVLSYAMPEKRAKLQIFGITFCMFFC